MYLSLCMHTSCVYLVPSEASVTDTLELELQVVVNFHMELGTERGSPARTPSALNSISLTPGEYVPPAHMVLKITGNPQFNTDIFTKGSIKDS